MPPGTARGISGGPKGLSDLHGFSDATEGTCFLRRESVRDILGIGVGQILKLKSRERD